MVISSGKMNIFEVAEYLFGPMRSSTDRELELEREMLERGSKLVGMNVFDLFEDESDDEQDRRGMLELHNLRSGTIETPYRGRGYINKFTTYTVGEDGHSRNYDFEPEYDLILYIYSISPRIKSTFREVKVQYGYMYQYSQGSVYSFPAFREIPKADDRKVNVWKVSEEGWEENEVIRVSTNFYAYSLPENRDLKKFLDGARYVVDSYKKKLTEKYERNMKNQDDILNKMNEVFTEIAD